MFNFSVLFNNFLRSYFILFYSNKKCILLDSTINKNSRTRRSSVSKTTKPNTTIIEENNKWNLVVSPTLLKQHNKKILDVLNKGNLKELQTLPTVGPKTAMVISNFRFVFKLIFNQ